MLTKKQAATMTPTQLVNSFGGTTAGAIRGCLKLGFTRGETSKLLKIRYQWVRNVDITPVKTAKVVDVTGREGSMEDLGVEQK